jgi:diacylglycerol kinase (ATP)
MNGEFQPPLQPRTTLPRSFFFALRGLVFFFRTQRNARIELLLAVVACGMGTWLRIGSVKGAILILTIALVLILEGINTAIEAVVDLACPDRHPLAKAAKDLAAAMVLIAALASAAVGILILGPSLLHKLR